MAQAKDAYVIMPFSGTKSKTARKWTEIFENLFKPAFEECGYPCSRAEPATGSLIGSIVEKMRYSWVVLADITDGNPNVFYELGVRHSLSRRTIVVAQKDEHVPSDLRGYWWLVYGTQPAQVTKFKADIKRILREIDADPEKTDSPVADFLVRDYQSVDAHLQREIVKKLTALFTELSGLQLSLQQAIRNPDADVVVAYECLGLLLNTLYVDLGPSTLSKAYELREELIRMQKTKLSEDRYRRILIKIMVLSGIVPGVRARILAGVFQEPASISSMFWRADSTQLPSTPLLKEDASLRKLATQKVAVPWIESPLFVGNELLGLICLEAGLDSTIITPDDPGTHQEIPGESRD